MRTWNALLVVAALGLVACREVHAAEATAGTRTTPAPASLETAFENGLGKGWQDYGWAPRDLGAGHPASLDLSKYGGWIIAKPGLKGTFGGLVIRYRAPASFGDFLEVRLDSSLAITMPRVTLSARHRRDLPEGWTEAFIPVSELNPKGYPFDRIVLRALREVGSEKVQIALLALTAAPPDQPVIEATGTLAPARPVRLAIDCRAPTHPISPLIYGIAYNQANEYRDHHQWELGTTARRWGGNPTSRYNWKLGNAWNTASDWYYRNVNYSDLPDFTYQRFLDEDLAHGVQTALTVPTLGWVAKDTKSYSFPVSVFGPQQSVAPEEPNAGNGVRKDGKILAPASPTQTSVPAPPEFIGEWVKTIRAHEQGKRSVHMYILDNEPALWNSTHRDVHPEPVTYDELLDRTINYAKAIKQADPDAVIAGPAEWGWPAYQYSAMDAAVGFRIHPDRLHHGDVPLIPWWLKRLKEYREKTGMKLVDILDVHFYPQGEGIGVGPKGATDSDTSARRIRATRALWDPSYVDESWIKEPVQLLPRLHKWIAENNPGLGISIGEWNFGAEEHMSGGLAAAEALGRFGQAGITSAFYWTYPPRGSPAFWAFRAYRNFDGQGGHFLDTSVATRSSDALFSVFASRDASGHMVAVLLNLDPATPADAQIELEGCAAPVQGRTFTYAGGGKGFAPADSPIHDGKVGTKVPPYAMTVIDLGPAKTK